MVLYPNKLPESERVCSGICISDRIIFPSEYGHLVYLLFIIYYVLTTLKEETLYL